MADVRDRGDEHSVGCADLMQLAQEQLRRPQMLEHVCGDDQVERRLSDDLGREASIEIGDAGPVGVYFRL